jgi:hypothetical protein
MIIYLLDLYFKWWSFFKIKTEQVMLEKVKLNFGKYEYELGFLIQFSFNTKQYECYL